MSFDHTQDWFYEGNISKVFVEYLKKNSHKILKDNSGNIKQKGVDIISQKNDIYYLSEVKGYPTEFYVNGPNKGEKKKTNPKLQAKHWLGEAILSSIFNYSEYKYQYDNIELCVVLPEIDRYKELLKTILPFFIDNCNCKIKFFLVNEKSEVKEFNEIFNSF